jgi:hypothetical protein
LPLIIESGRQISKTEEGEEVLLFKANAIKKINRPRRKEKSFLLGKRIRPGTGSRKKNQDGSPLRND